MQEDQLNSLLDRVKEALAKLSPSGSIPAFSFGDADLFTNTKLYFGSKSEAGEYLKGLDEAAQSISVLRKFISGMSEDQKMRLDGHGRSFYYPDEEISELSVGKIAGMHGVSDSLKSVLSLFEDSLKDEREEICEEIKKYWSGLGRSKSWNAYHVALRIAKMFYDENGKPPTFSVDYDGNPSNLYTSVVSEVFGILSYYVNFKEPAKWARKEFIRQLELGNVEQLRDPRTAIALIKQFSSSGYLKKRLPVNFQDISFPPETEEDN